MVAQNDTPCQSPRPAPALPSFAGRLIRPLAEGWYAVESSRAGHEPHQCHPRSGTCTCPDHVYRNRRCVHLLDVDCWIAERQAAARALLVCGACGEPASRLFDGNTVCAACSLVGRRAS